MLGIRKFEKTSIDLYQGDAETFVCDSLVFFEDKIQDASKASCKLPLSIGFDSTSNPDTDTIRSSIRSCLSRSDDKGMRHICFIELEEQGKSNPPLSITMMHEIQSYLVEFKSTNIKRITFIVNSKESYLSYQTSLYKAFPEKNASK